MKIIYFLFFALLIFSAGCGRQEEDVVTFAVGGAPAEVAFWETLVNDFTRETGVGVRILRQPTDTDLRRQELVISLEARKHDPDIFLLDVAWIAQFAASGWLYNLPEDDLDLAVFFQRVLNLADRYRGKLIALPVYVDGGLLYYRSDLLRKYGFSSPPQTWQELVDYSLKVQAGEREADPSFYGFVWQGAQYEGLICDFLEFAVSAGGGIALQGDQITVASRANERALQLMTDLIHKDKISPPNTFTEMKEEQVRIFFEQGHALFERNWPYAWGLHQGKDSAVRGKVGIAPLPHFPGAESAAALGGWQIGISAYSDLKKESFQFLKYVTSRAVQKKLALKLGWNPGRTDVYDDPEVLRRMPYLSELREVFAHAYPRPLLPYYTLISEVLQRYLNAALSGKQPVPAALAAAQKDSQRIVDEYSR